MGGYGHRITSYAFLPLWRCELCNLEMECRGEGRTFVVMTITVARAKFVKKHSQEKPNCPGSYAYVPGVKKPKGDQK